MSGDFPSDINWIKQFLKSPGQTRHTFISLCKEEVGDKDKLEVVADLGSHMLDDDTSRRYSIDQVLNHKLFQDLKCVGGTVLENKVATNNLITSKSALRIFEQFKTVPYDKDITSRILFTAVDLMYQTIHLVLESSTKPMPVEISSSESKLESIQSGATHTQASVGASSTQSGATHTQPNVQTVSTQNAASLVFAHSIACCFLAWKLEDLVTKNYLELTDDEFLKDNPCIQYTDVATILEMEKRIIMATQGRINRDFLYDACTNAEDIMNVVHFVMPYPEKYYAVDQNYLSKLKARAVTGKPTLQYVVNNIE